MYLPRLHFKLAQTLHGQKELVLVSEHGKFIDKKLFLPGPVSGQCHTGRRKPIFGSTARSRFEKDLGFVAKTNRVLSIVLKPRLNYVISQVILNAVFALESCDLRAEIVHLLAV